MEWLLRMTEMLVVCSPGGHYAEARSLVAGLEDVDFKYVVHDLRSGCEGVTDRVIVAPHAERDPRALWQFLFAIYIVWKERPKVVLSTGALIAVTFGVAARMFGSKFVFVESPTRISSPSLSARICYKFADRFYVRYPGLLAIFPKAIFLH